MNFSEIFPSTLSVLSPSGHFLALSSSSRVIIKNIADLETVQVFSFQDPPLLLSFSPSSSLILCLSKSGVEARSLEEEDWYCRIEDNLAGILNAIWTPDDRQIITFSDFQLKATIYNLSTKTQCIFRNPKYIDKGYSFSHNGKFFALAERREGKDYVGIYFIGDWKLLNFFQTETFDLADLVWSPDDSVIAVWDTILEYKLLIYCPATGLLAKFQPYDSALGLKSLQFSENSQFLALGSFDEKVRLLNTLTWKLINEFEFKAPEGLIYFQEELDLDAGGYKNPNKPSKFILKEFLSSTKIPSLKPTFDKPNPPLGPSLIRFSPSSTYIAVRNDNQPNALWIFHVPSLSLKVFIIFLNSIKNFNFQSKNESFIKNESNKISKTDDIFKNDELCICTGSGKIYFWTEEGPMVCEMPFEGRAFGVGRVEWGGEGRVVIVGDKGETVVASFEK